MSVQPHRLSSGLYCLIQGGMHRHLFRLLVRQACRHSSSPHVLDQFVCPNDNGFAAVVGLDKALVVDGPTHQHSADTTTTHENGVVVTNHVLCLYVHGYRTTTVRPRRLGSGAFVECPRLHVYWLSQTNASAARLPLASQVEHQLDERGFFMPRTRPPTVRPRDRRAAIPSPQIDQGLARRFGADTDRRPTD